MADLKMPNPSDGPRVPPLSREQVNAYVRTEYDKSIHTWGIPNNLIRTMAWLPRLALTEVNYVNAFLFDEGVYALWPRPGGTGPTDLVLFPEAGFVDRVTKELVINLVGLLNRSRYSITHHTVIGYNTLSAGVAGKDEAQRKRRAESMLLHLVNGNGEPDFENIVFEEDGTPLYSELQLAALRLAVKLRGDAHDVTDEEFEELRKLLHENAKEQIDPSFLGSDLGEKRSEYIGAFVNGMIVELTWCIVHFAGLLNKWFTVLKIMDETDAVRDGIDFFTFYNNSVPDRIKERNNKILGRDGWGNP